MKHIKLAICVITCIIIVATMHVNLRKHSIMYNLLFSPSDLYNNLAESDFNISDKGLTKEFKINHKYPGNYWVTLLVENPVESGKSYDSDFLLQISVLNNDAVILKRIVSDTSFWFWGGKGHSGFSFMNYKVPNDLPIGVTVTFKIIVLKESTHFESKYGRQKIVISKLSDE